MKRIAVVWTLVCVLGSLFAMGASAEASCAGDGSGGDWPSYGHDLSNTRNQDQEKTISSSNAGSLAPAWVFHAPPEAGGFQSTPIVAEGCVYVSTNNGYIYALNADTGDVVWGDQYASAPVTGVCCGGTLFALSVMDGVAYAHVSENPATAPGGGPHALAIDAHSGEVIWNSGPLATEAGAYTNASPVVFNGLDFFGISGAEAISENPGSEPPSTPGGFAILDAATGTLLKRTRSIPESDSELGYTGGSIWSTAAVDLETRYAYAGTGQPASPNKEHEHTNAILKIDVDRSRATFGEIVDAYKATPDTYVDQLDAQKPCQENPNLVTCVRSDVDFAASPTLYRDFRGKKMVAEFQKSGILHAAYADTMEKAWEARLAVSPGYLGNYASTATDGSSLFGAGAWPGQVWSIERNRGGYNWVMPTGSVWGANPLAYANGVVYHADGKGVLNAFEVASGLPLLTRPMSADTGVNVCTNQGGGVAIARNTVYAACGEGAQGMTAFSGGDTSGGPFFGAIIAYRPA